MVVLLMFAAAFVVVGITIIVLIKGVIDRITTPINEIKQRVIELEKRVEKLENEKSI